MTCGAYHWIFFSVSNSALLFFSFVFYRNWNCFRIKCRISPKKGKSKWTDRILRAKIIITEHSESFFFFISELTTKTKKTSKHCTSPKLNAIIESKCIDYESRIYKKKKIIIEKWTRDKVLRDSNIHSAKWTAFCVCVLYGLQYAIHQFDCNTQYLFGIWHCVRYSFSFSFHFHFHLFIDSNTCARGINTVTMPVSSVRCTST